MFDEWAAALHAQGIRIISGHVIGDDNAIAEPGWGMGWSWDDLQYGFAAPIGALQYNENQIEVVVGPGMAPGAQAIITTSPAGSGILVDAQRDDRGPWGRELRRHHPRARHIVSQSPRTGRARRHTNHGDGRRRQSDSALSQCISRGARTAWHHGGWKHAGRRRVGHAAGN